MILYDSRKDGTTVLSQILRSIPDSETYITTAVWNGKGVMEHGDVHFESIRDFVDRLCDTLARVRIAYIKDSEKDVYHLLVSHDSKAMYEIYALNQNGVDFFLSRQTPGKPQLRVVEYIQNRPATYCADIELNQQTLF